MDLRLAGRTILITGAASGIGRACAHAFAAEGAGVGLIDVDDARGRELEAELGGSAHFVHADMTDQAQVAAAVDSLAASFDGIDAVIGCAGVSGPFGRTIDNVSAGDFHRVLEINVTGQFILAQACTPYLRSARSPSIVFLASDSSFVAAPEMLAYNASKGALLQLTRALSGDLIEDGIRVNCVCPSIVDTPLARADLKLSGEELRQQHYPVQSPEQVAHHVLYLASSVSAPVNGTSLVSDFGYLARSSFPA